jgi:hypothetical protein
VKVRCPECGKKYLLKGRPPGPAIKCPKCSATIKVAPGAEPSRSALREELSRLAAEGDADSPQARAPRMQVTDPEEEQMFSTRGRVMLLIASILLLLLALGGGAAWLAMRLGGVTLTGDGMAVVVGNNGAEKTPDEGVGTETPVETAVQAQPADELPPGVKQALRQARRPVPVCQEEQAVEKWRAALRLLKEHEDIAAQEIAQAEQRIAELTETIDERRRQVEKLQSDLEKARASAEGGREPRARVLLQNVMRELGRLPCRGALADDLRETAVALQQQLESGQEDSGEPAVKPPTIADDPDHILDKPAPGTENRWRRENWANTIEVELKGEGEDLYRSLVHKRGSKQKWVVTMARPIDLTEYKFLLIDMKVHEPVRVALGVWVGNQLYESRAKALRKQDKWQNVTFDLKSNDFKCADTNWNFGARIADPAAVTRFSLFFYSQARSPILFANVRLHEGE